MVYASPVFFCTCSFILFAIQAIYSTKIMFSAIALICWVANLMFCCFFYALTIYVYLYTYIRIFCKYISYWNIYVTYCFLHLNCILLFYICHDYFISSLLSSVFYNNVIITIYNYKVMPFFINNFCFPPYACQMLFI